MQLLWFIISHIPSKWKMRHLGENMHLVLEVASLCLFVKFKNCNYKTTHKNLDPKNWDSTYIHVSFIILLQHGSKPLHIELNHVGT